MVTMSELILVLSLPMILPVTQLFADVTLVFLSAMHLIYTNLDAIRILVL